MKNTPLKRKEKLIAKFKSKNREPVIIEKGKGIFDDLNLTFHPETIEWHTQTHGLSPRSCSNCGAWGIKCYKCEDWDMWEEKDDKQ